MRELYEEGYKNNFSFGKNWQDFLKKLDDKRIERAKKSLVDFLGIDNLVGKTFVDVGCGSGLFSLAAKMLGAEKVLSIDIDESSVLCANYLKDKYFSNDESWQIKHGSALDQDFIEKQGKYDIVYSWGVLHHTGDMWRAIKNVEKMLKKEGLFYLALYNEKTGFQSSVFWKKVKETYSKSGYFVKKLIEVVYLIQFFLKGILKFENRIKYIKTYRSKRGMNWWTDVKDWLGGHPYEFAKVDKINSYFKEKGYKIIKTKDCSNGTGCNEFLIKF